MLRREGRFKRGIGLLFFFYLDIKLAKIDGFSKN
jgi:hypothetical protein